MARNALLDFLQSASNEAAGAVSGPVDLLGMGLRGLGVPVPKNALLSSQWMADRGLTRPVQNGAAQVAGATVGLLSPVAAAAKAPQIARGLLQMGENAAAPGLLNRGGASAQRGIFMGDLSKTWDKAAAAKAAQLEKAGADPRAIWRETGTFKGPDGKWRQEIDDSAAAMYTPQTGWEGFAANLELSGPARGVVENLRAGKMYAPEAESQLRKLLDTAEGADYRAASAARRELQQFRPTQSGPPEFVGNALEHRGLMDAYPDAAGIKYREGAGGVWDDSRGMYSEANDAINLNVADQAGKKSTLLHELQHAIQGRQGFARGGSPEAMKATLPDAQAVNDAQVLRTIVSRGAAPENARAEFLNMLGRDAHPVATDLMFKPLDELLAMNPMGAYKRLAGEAEARAVQKRMNLTPQFRRSLFPLDSYDVPIDSLIIR